MKETNAIARHYFDNQTYTSRLKPDNSVVTQADQEIEQIVRQAASHLEGVHVLGEEFSPDQPLDGTVVTVDPIDGTANFVRGIPMFGTLISVIQNREVLVGAVSEPISADFWFAQTGSGCFKNGQQVRVSSRESLEESLVLHGSLYGSEATQTPDTIHRVLAASPRQRGIGDFKNILLVAEGKADVALDFGLKIWDKAPLIRLIEEAGGIITDRVGLRDRLDGDVIASNPQIHPVVLALLAQN